MALVTMQKAKKNNRILAGLLVVAGAIVGWGAFWYSAVAPVAAQFILPHPVSVMFMGDIMLDRNVAVAIRTNGAASLFASSSALFSSTDLRVANLEGPITDNPSIAQVDPSKLHFTFDPAEAEAALAPLKLSAVSQANNHAYDFGRTGYLQSRDYLAQWGIAAFGHPYNTSGLSTVITSRGKSICLVGYMELYDASTTNVLNTIATLRPQCDKVVVFAHWGVEYKHSATSQQQAEAHSFIDAGADLVIGAHPHVVEPMEVYKDRAIFYSLGNAMFDQDFSWGTMHGLAIRADFYKDKTVYTLIPVTVAGETQSISSEADAHETLGLVTQGAVASVTLP